MISAYDWPGGRETMLRLGPAEGPVVLAAMPLFEEANRARALVVTVMRALAAHGIGSALPDLPGTGESLVPLEAATLADWRAAFAAAAAGFAAEGRPVHLMAIRGGVLVDRDAAALSRWHLSPIRGDSLVRDLIRARAIAEPGQPIGFDPAAPGDGPPVELAGNLISRRMLAELTAAEVPVSDRTRIVRLAGETGVFDCSFVSRIIWRQAEPDNNPELAAKLAEDLGEWIQVCGA